MSDTRMHLSVSFWKLVYYQFIHERITTTTTKMCLLEKTLICCSWWEVYVSRLIRTLKIPNTLQFYYLDYWSHVSLWLRFQWQLLSVPNFNVFLLYIREFVLTPKYKLCKFIVPSTLCLALLSFPTKVHWSRAWKYFPYSQKLIDL